MSRVIAAVRRHLPAGRNRAVQRAFLQGYHAGQHDAAGECLGPDQRCELWEQIDR